MYRKFIWPALTVLVLILVVTFASGFGVAIAISNSNDELSDLVVTESNSQNDGLFGMGENDINSSDIDNVEVDNPEEVDKDNKSAVEENPATAKEVEAKVEENILVMGDSIGFGFGDDANSGIGNRYVSFFEEGAKESSVYNISVSGDEVSDLLLVVNKIENEAIIKDMDLIIISIGGNDLNRITFDDIIELKLNYDSTLNEYKEELTIIIDRIRTLNQEATIAVVGLYDPFANNQEKTDLLLNWNYETQLLVGAMDGIVYVPTYNNFKNNLDAYLAFDRFHPGPLGYEFIAKELYEILHGIE